MTDSIPSKAALLASLTGRTVLEFGGHAKDAALGVVDVASGAMDVALLFGKNAKDAAEHPDKDGAKRRMDVAVAVAKDDLGFLKDAASVLFAKKASDAATTAQNAASMIGEASVDLGKDLAGEASQAADVVLLKGADVTLATLEKAAEFARGPLADTLTAAYVKVGDARDALAKKQQDKTQPTP